MIEETARVVALDGDYAEVETERRNACGGCSAQAGCGSALLARFFGNRRSRLWVRNGIGAAPGERVVIGLQEDLLLRASFALYGVPLLAMIAGAVAGQQVGGPDSQLPGLFGGLLGLAGGLLWPRRLGRRSGNGRDSQVVVLRRAVASGILVTPP